MKGSTLLDVLALDGGTTTRMDGEDRASYVGIETVLDRNDGLLHEPSVPFDAVVGATPATVDVTYHLGELEYWLAVPVYVRHDVYRLD